MEVLGSHSRCSEESGGNTHSWVVPVLIISKQIPPCLLLCSRYMDCSGKSQQIKCTYYDNKTSSQYIYCNIFKKTNRKKCSWPLLNNNCTVKVCTEKCCRCILVTVYNSNNHKMTDDEIFWKTTQYHTSKLKHIHYIHIVWPAGLVWDYITLVACPAPFHKNMPV